MLYRNTRAISRLWRRSADAARALAFLAWEVTSNGSSLPTETYLDGWRHYCANASRPVYVAADSRAAILMARAACAAPVVSVAGVRLHAACRSAG